MRDTSILKIAAVAGFATCTWAVVTGELPPADPSRVQPITYTFETIEDLTNTLSKEPYNNDAWNRLARIFSQDPANYEQAIQTWLDAAPKKLLNKHGGEGLLRYWTAQTLHHQLHSIEPVWQTGTPAHRAITQAEAALSAFIANRPDNATSLHWHVLGRSQIHLDQPARAEASLRHTHDLVRCPIARKRFKGYQLAGRIISLGDAFNLINKPEDAAIIWRELATRLHTEGEHRPGGATLVKLARRFTSIKDASGAVLSLILALDTPAARTEGDASRQIWRALAMLSLPENPALTPEDRKAALDACATIESTLQVHTAARTSSLAWAYLRLNLPEKAHETWERAVAKQQRTVQSDPKLPGHHFNLACFTALAGDENAALDAWEKAVELGYRNLDQADRDPDLQSIRTHPRYIAAHTRAHGNATQGLSRPLD